MSNKFLHAIVRSECLYAYLVTLEAFSFYSETGNKNGERKPRMFKYQINSCLLCHRWFWYNIFNIIFHFSVYFLSNINSGVHNIFYEYLGFGIKGFGAIGVGKS